MTTLPMSPALDPGTAPYLLSFQGTEPELASAPRTCGAGSSIVGRVRIGARAVIAPTAVVRGDGHFVRIGDDVALGEGSTVHIAHEVYPAIIGNGVTVGRNAVVHACTVRDGCVIEDDAVVLDGSLVESNVLIEAGATVYPRSTLKSWTVYAGSRATAVRALTPGELAQRKARLLAGIEASAASGSGTQPPDRRGRRGGVFVARTAVLAGRVELGARSSVFFGCRLDAGVGAIVVGESCNIQDNTRIRSTAEGLEIGRDTTIGHNVEMADGRIGARALVGIGSVLAGGTVVEDDVLLAAGSTTEPGQWLETGWLWGGRPARAISRLDTLKRTMMSDIIGQYCAYARAYIDARSRNEG